MPFTRYGWNTYGLRPLLPRGSRWLGIRPQPDEVERHCHKLRKRVAFVTVPLLTGDLMCGPDAVALATTGAAIAIQLAAACAGTPARSRPLLYAIMVSGGVRISLLAARGTDALVVLLAVPCVVGVQASCLAQVSFALTALLCLPPVVILAVLGMSTGSLPGLMSRSAGALGTTMGILTSMVLHAIFWRSRTVALPFASVVPEAGDNRAERAAWEAEEAERGAEVALRASVQAARVAERRATKQDLFAVEMFLRHVWDRPGRPERLCPKTATRVAEFLGPAWVSRVERLLKEVRAGPRQNPWLSEGSGRSVTMSWRRVVHFIAANVRGEPNG
mmetsp:Transcript_31614/g.94147  ORF Transcript_31614/g.94147 Transcript_31614/m.94147 type:complete len:332 (-) Transcript_31614:54-1049(-)